MNVRQLHPVEVVEKPKREFNPEAVIFIVCAFLAGILCGTTWMTYQQKHQPPAQCARFLDDGRRLMANDLAADGRETRCVYEAPKHDKQGRIVHGRP